jgi:hypothetical protein
MRATIEGVGMFMKSALMIVLLGLAACSPYRSFNDQQMTYRDACQGGDFDACADLAHSVADIDNAG